MPCKKNKKETIVQKLLGYWFISKQTEKKNDSEKFQTVTSLEGNKAVQ